MPSKHLLLTLPLLASFTACAVDDPETSETDSELSFGCSNHLDPFAIDAFGTDAIFSTDFEVGFDQGFCDDDLDDWLGGGGGIGGLGSPSQSCSLSRQYTGNGSQYVQETGTRTAAQAQSIAESDAKRFAIADGEQKCRSSWSFVPLCYPHPTVVSVTPTGCVTHDHSPTGHTCYAQATVNCDYSF